VIEAIFLELGALLVCTDFCTTTFLGFLVFACFEALELLDPED
jgi:hypothetical protein